MKKPPRMAVYRRSQGLCGICGEPVETMHFHVDHIVPKSRGGDDSIENLQAAHAMCNMKKGRQPSMTSLQMIEAAANDVSAHYLKLQGAIEVRNRLILRAYNDGGVTLAEIAKSAGLSHQRIHQLVYEVEPEDNGR